MDKYEDEIKKFGMLHEYHDCKEYLLEKIHLVSEDTANYLTLWCVNLEVEEVRKKLLKGTPILLCKLTNTLFTF